MCKPIFIFFILLFQTFLINAQEDEIILKQTGQPLDYRIRIVEITNDSLKYKAFSKINVFSLGDVKSFRHNGHWVTASEYNKYTPEQKASLAINKRDSIKSFGWKALRLKRYRKQE